MPKVRPRKRSKGVPHTKGQTLDEYIAAQYRADPGLRRRVQAELRKIEKEQEAAKRRRARKRAAARRRREARAALDGGRT